MSGGGDRDQNREHGAFAGGEGTEAERLVSLAADLVLATEILPGPSTTPDLEALRQRTLLSRRRGAGGRSARAVRGWRLRPILAGLILAGGAAALVTAFRLGERAGTGEAALSYVVEGTSTVRGDTIESPAAGPGIAADTRVRFTEGTAIALAPGSRLRVAGRSPVGADVVLDRGRASFTVVHRPQAHWHVVAGPFVVDVTGTRFSLEWGERQKLLTVLLDSGGVVVRGNAAGPGIALRAGQKLVASVDGKAAVEPMEHAADARPPAVAPPVAAPPVSAAESPAPVELPRSPANARARRPVTRTVALASPGGATAAANESAARPLGAGMPSYLQPPPVAPSAPSLAMGGGGLFCTAERSALGFEEPDNIVSVPPFYHLALAAPRADGTHSWCGTGSVRVDARFDEDGRRNFMGRLPHQSGGLIVRLPHLMDFTDKTVRMHVYIDGPAGARVAAQLFVVHHGKWVNGPVVDHLSPGRWWTISHTFRAENPLTVGPPYPPAGTSLVTDCDRVALIVYSTAGPRTWTGALYVDDVGWK